MKLVKKNLEIESITSLLAPKREREKTYKINREIIIADHDLQLQQRRQH